MVLEQSAVGLEQAALIKRFFMLLRDSDAAKRAGRGRPSRLFLRRTAEGYLDWVGQWLGPCAPELTLE